VIIRSFLRFGPSVDEAAVPAHVRGWHVAS
jgi:hypothetical protein